MSLHGSMMLIVVRVYMYKLNTDYDKINSDK